MSKREILRAAKKHGVTIVDAYYGWTATPGEMMPGWTVQFGPEMDDEIEYFDNSQEAVAWINENAAKYRAAIATTQPPAGKEEAAIGREVEE